MELLWDVYDAVLKNGWFIVDQQHIYAERLFGAAMKRRTKHCFSPCYFLKRLRSLCLFFPFFLWSGLFCCVFVPGTVAFHLLYTLIDCDCKVYSVSQSVVVPV